MATKAPRTAPRSNIIVEIEPGAWGVTLNLTWYLTGVRSQLIHRYPKKYKRQLIKRLFSQMIYNFFSCKVLVILTMGTLWMQTPSGFP